MKCPNCRLISPPQAERCDCGFDFSSGKIEESYLSDKDRQLRAKPKIWPWFIGWSVVNGVFRLVTANQEHAVAILLGVGLLTALFIVLWIKRSPR
jgi:hypothetical protein